MRRFYLRERHVGHDRLPVLDVEQVDQYFLSCQMKTDYVISSDTLVLLDLSKVTSDLSGNILVVERGRVPFIIRDEMDELLERDYGSTLYTQREKEQVLTRFLGKRYRYPRFLTVGIFMPFTSDCNKVIAWLNLIHIRKLKTVKENQSFFNGCQIEFVTGLSIQLPKSSRAVKRTLALDVNYSLLYYYFIYWSSGLLVEETTIIQALNQVVSHLGLEVSIGYNNGLFQQMGVYFSFLRIARSLIESEGWTLEELEDFFTT